MIIGLSASAKQVDIFTVKGQLTEKDNLPVMFANVVILKSEDKTIAAGGVSDEKGFFSLSVPQGKYILSVSFIGYKTVDKELTVSSNLNLGQIKMEADAAVLSDVNITAKMTERKGDRIVVNLAYSPLVEGKTTKDILNYTPGVWLDNKGELSINGQKNVRVMINDRDVNMSGEELLAYLDGLNASDILKIEVIPMAGAEYEADSAGGVIHITLKKRAVEGMNGNVGLDVSQNRYFKVAPWMNFSFRKNRLSLNTRYRYGDGTSFVDIEEQTNFLTNDIHQQTATFNKSKNKSHYATVDAVYDLTKNSEIGAAFEYRNGHNNDDLNGRTLQIESRQNTDVISGVKQTENDERFNATIYYKIKTDTIGSSLKIIGDYTSNVKSSYMLSSAYYYPENAPQMSNIYDYSAPTNVYLYSIRADFNKKTTGKVSWSTGVKYSDNKISSQAKYHTYHGDNWSSSDPRNNEFEYREKVATAYGRLDATLPKGWSMTAGLRLEYTSLITNSLTMEQEDKQDYVDIFPQLSVMKTFGQEKKHSLSLNYTRRLSRPSYSLYNPYVMPLSEFSYVIGNPDIKPSYKNRYSITGVLFSKYSISAEYGATAGRIQQMAKPSPEDENKTVYQHVNLGNVYDWNLSFSAPINVTKWYGINLSGYMEYEEQSFDNERTYNFTIQGSMQNSFTFGKGWSSDVSAWWISEQKGANMVIDPMFSASISVVKKCLKNRLVFSFNVDDIFGTLSNTINISNSQFNKHVLSHWSGQTVSLGVRWNFINGKKSKTKQVETGNNDDRNRL